MRLSLAWEARQALGGRAQERDNPIPWKSHQPESQAQPREPRSVRTVDGQPNFKHGPVGPEKAGEAGRERERKKERDQTSGLLAGPAGSRAPARRRPRAIAISTWLFMDTDGSAHLLNSLPPLRPEGGSSLACPGRPRAIFPSRSLSLPSISLSRPWASSNAVRWPRQSIA